MFNELLKEQLQKYFGDELKIPAELSAFVSAVNETYNNFNSKVVVKSAEDMGAAELKEQNIKLRSEAEELIKAHNEFGRILDSVNYGFFSREMPADRYTYLSSACERIYGYSVEQFFKDNLLWFSVIHPEDKAIIDSDNERLLRREQVYSQYRIIHKDRTVRWIESTIIPFFKDDLLIRLDGVIADITARKQVENEREAIMKELLKTNGDLKQFSYITSHNLRAPLSNIHAIVNMFDLPENDFHNRQMLQMLRASTQQLNSTIDDLTNILIIKNGVDIEVNNIKLADCFNQVIKTFSTQLDDVKAEVITNFMSPYVALNKIYLESIFVNLVSNAIKYRSKTRKLSVRVESSEDNLGNVVIRFSDNGTGIDLSRHKERVFGLYQRFHDDVEGRGVGLFIMKSQIEASGGWVLIESEPGRGTTFILTLKQKPGL